MEMEEQRLRMKRLLRCPAGYDWYQVGGGWRCGGGSHFASNQDLERMYSQ